MMKKQSWKLFSVFLFFPFFSYSQGHHLAQLLKLDTVQSQKLTLMMEDHRKKVSVILKNAELNYHERHMQLLTLSNVQKAKLDSLIGPEKAKKMLELMNERSKLKQQNKTSINISN